MRVNGALRRFPLSCRNPQFVANADRRDSQHAIQSAYIALYKRFNLVGLGRNLAHLQCAGKRAEQSPSDCRDHVIEGRWQFLVRLDTVKGLDRPVHAEANRLRKRFDPCVPERPFDALEANLARVNLVGHGRMVYHGAAADLLAAAFALLAFSA
jgi:hypothetical protein